MKLFDVYRLVEDDIDIQSVAFEVLQGNVKYKLFSVKPIAFSIFYILTFADIPAFTREAMLSWSNSVLSDR